MAMRTLISSAFLKDTLQNALGAEGWTIAAPAEPGPALLGCASAHPEAEILALTPFDDASARVIEALPSNLKLIASYGVGADHIDLAAARARGLHVSTTPDASTPCLADFTMGLIIAACRRMAEGLTLARSGHGRAMIEAQDWGLRVSGKKLGIVGMGRVGQALARRARGFDMTIRYHTPRPSAELDAAFGAQSRSLKALLEEADIVSLHCPLTPATHHLIDAAALAAMKKDAVLINISRGPLIDEAALVTALREGALFAAALDVFETEPDIREDLRSIERAFLTPHMASATWESRAGMAEQLIDNIRAFAKDGAPLNPV